MQLVMEAVQGFPSTRIQEPVADTADQVYQEMKNRGPGRVWKCLEHPKRTPLDDISKKLRLRGRIRTMVAIDTKVDGQPTSFALFAEWDDNQAPYQAPPRKRRSEAA